MTSSESISENLVQFEQLPEHAQTQFAPLWKSLEGYAFVDRVFTLESSKGISGEQIVGAAMHTRHSSGRCIFQHIVVRNEQGTFDSKSQVATILTGSRWIGTVAGRQTFNLMPGITSTYHPKCSAMEIVEIHERKLIEFASSIIRIDNVDSLLHQIFEMRARADTHMVDRGIYIELFPNANAELVRSGS